MKYFTRLKKYKASNVEFDCETQTAWSYDWWCFYKVYKGITVFNNTTYSPSTCGHQSKVKRLLNYNYDVTLNHTTENMTNMELALKDNIKGLKYEIRDLIKTIKKPRTQKKKNEERKVFIAGHIKEIYQLRSLLNKVV